MKKKRALSTDEGGSENADEEEELTYLPIYNDPDEQFLIRHKFSPISKRSENSQPSANPQANVEEFKESYGTFLVLYAIYELTSNCFLIYFLMILYIFQYRIPCSCISGRQGDPVCALY